MTVEDYLISPTTSISDSHEHALAVTSRPRAPPVRAPGIGLALPLFHSLNLSLRGELATARATVLRLLIAQFLGYW